MAIVNIESIKSKFEAGDYPRSSDYIDMIDTLGATILKFQTGNYYRSPVVSASADRTATNNQTVL